jgi:hypothetical protein
MNVDNTMSDNNETFLVDQVGEQRNQQESGTLADNETVHADAPRNSKRKQETGLKVVIQGKRAKNDAANVQAAVNNAQVPKTKKEQKMVMTMLLILLILCASEQVTLV